MTIRTSSFVAGVADGCFVFVHSDRPPTDAEWEQALDLYRAAPNRAGTRTIIFSKGGAPSAKQRAGLNALFGEAKPLMAVLTRSTLVRAAGVAISWFNPRFKIFDAEDAAGAFAHLGISGRERDNVVRTLESLQAELVEPAGRKIG